jgi:hypothetical protein
VVRCSILRRQFGHIDGKDGIVLRFKNVEDTGAKANDIDEYHLGLLLVRKVRHVSRNLDIVLAL